MEAPGNSAGIFVPVDKVILQMSSPECGKLLQFYMPVAFAPDTSLGTHVATAENDGWLNVYAAYDLNTGKPCSALDVILVCGDSSEFAFRYPLAKQEQAALLEKMDAYCREQTGMALAFQAVPGGEPQPRQLSQSGSCEARRRPYVRPAAMFRREGGPGAASPENCPVEAVSPRFCRRSILVRG